MQARTLDLKSMSSRLAASVPVHAPVPGSGMPTNSSSAQGRPRPALAFSFAALVALLKAEGEKLADDRLIRAPLQHLACKEEDERYRDHVADDGNDVHLPQRQAQPPRRRGIAPRSSMMGTIEMKKNAQIL